MENDNSKLKVIFSTNDGRLLYLDSRGSGGDCTIKVIPMSLPSKIKYSYPKRRLNILGSCNGFLCMHPWWSNDIYLWNPYTDTWNHGVMSLPRDNIEGIFGYNIKSLVNIACGFGYNLKCRHYIVLCIRNFSPHESVVTVFALKSNSGKMLGKIPYVIRCTSYFDFERGILVNGSLHWIATKEDRIIILSYNINVEKFSEVPMPNGKNLINIYTRMGLLQDYLCVCLPEEPFRLGSWIMAEYGKKESWTMMFNIRHALPFHVRPLCLTSYRKEILLVDERMQGSIKALDFYLYDRDQQSMRKSRKINLISGVTLDSGVILDAITYMQ